MNKYDRLFYILNLLRSRKNMNAQMLARECEVTERSIYRDLITLSEANVPIYYDNGYKLASENFLPPLNFDFDEYHLLRLALDSSPLSKTGKYRETYRKVKAKIDSCLSDNIRQQSKFSPETTQIDILVSYDIKQVARYFSIIEKAVSQSKRLKIKYASIKSGESERIVEPYFIVFRGNAFYFVAYCHLKEKLRTFRIDRIREIETLSDFFEKRDDVDASSYFKGSWQVYSGKPVEVVVKLTGAAARVVTSSRHHPEERIEIVNDDEVIYKVVTRGVEEIRRWILGFGTEAEVIKPRKLHRDLHRIGMYLKTKYN